jgi:hypothetical protein
LLPYNRATSPYNKTQRATAQSKTGIFRGYGAAEAPPGFQVGWSDCMYFFSLSEKAYICDNIMDNIMGAGGVRQHRNEGQSYKRLAYL